MKISIDRDLCIGSGMCLGAAPTVFDLDYESKAVLLLDDLEDERASIEEAVALCPVEALAIIERDE